MVLIIYYGESRIPHENLGGSNKSHATCGQSNNWSNDEVKALIALWSEADIQNAQDDPHYQECQNLPEHATMHAPYSARFMQIT